MVFEIVFSNHFSHNEHCEKIDMRNSIQRGIRAVFLLIFLCTLTSCSVVKMLVAQSHSRDRFIPSQLNPDVRYEVGSQDMAERIAKSVGHSLEVVEQTHGARMTHAPLLFVCRTSCFKTFVPVSEEIAAAQFGDAVFMNDDVLKLREQQRGMLVENFLTHELAHLLLYQRAGPMAYIRVPSWFREGIAVAVSNGAGAEACTPTEAAQNILVGSNFDPAEVGSMFHDRTASTYGLRPSIFYRQAGLFVDYLKELNPSAFQEALNDILTGQDFQESFARAYGQSISSQWPGFMVSMEELVAQH